MASSPITSWQIDGATMETVTDLILGGSKITADGDWSHEIKRPLAPWKKSYDQPSQNIKKQTNYFANKGPSNQSYGFSSSYVWMWELDCEEGWAPKNWCFWTVVLEKALESPMDCSTPGLPVHHQLLEFTKTHVQSVMPSKNLILCCPLLLLPSIFPSSSLFQWVSSLHQVAKLLELQLQHQSIQWIFRVDFLWDWLVWLPCS